MSTACPEEVWAHNELAQAQDRQEGQKVIAVRSVGTRIALTAATIVATLLLAGAAQAFAAQPWWHVNVVSAPAAKAGGEAQVVIEVTNLGDTMANNSTEPVKVVDKLPPGVTATGIYGEGASSLGWNQHLLSSCSLAATTCTYMLPIYPYERTQTVIDVKVASGAGDGVNEVQVSGGGANPVVARRALALEGPHAPFGVQYFEMTPEDESGQPVTQAGAHPFQLTTSFALNLQALRYEVPAEGPAVQAQPIAQAKDLHFNLPPGLVGNPTPIPQCPIYTFLVQAKSALSMRCPDDSVVGVATVMVQKITANEVHAPLTFTAPLYNIVPSAGEPARFGFIVGEFTVFGVPVVLDTSVRTGSDYGVVVKVNDIPQTQTFLGSQVTFWGSPSDHLHDLSRNFCLIQGTEFFNLGLTENRCSIGSGQPFLIMPTSCAGAPAASLEADSWTEAGKFTPPKEYAFQNGSGERYSMDGCNRLSFEPSINVTPDGQQASTPTGLTVDVHVPQDASLNPAGTAEATVKDTTVTLPAGVGLNPAGADGLQSCTLQQIGLESPGEQSCPEASKVGTVEISTPLLPNALKGAAYLAQQDANPFGSLVALYIVARDPVSGVLVKLAGQVTPDPVTGQLVSTFKNTPQLPFEDLRLHFFGGSRAPLGTPALCGAYTTTASIAPWSGAAPVDSSSTFEITSGPSHAACPNPTGDMSANALPFAPELTTGSLNIQAGAFTPFTMTMSREDGNQNLDSIQLKMPPGLLGTLSGVKLCGEPQADQGTCGSESLIGHTIVSVGLGGNPYTVKGGEVFITGPYGGAPYGLSIVNPAKAGPFDLGKVIVRAKVEVDPTTAALTITSDTNGPYRIPTIIDGIPLQIKHVNVTIDRSAFTFNPTNCEPQQITGGLTSNQGATSALSVPFQVTNCAILKFKPKFTASTIGKTSRATGAALSVKLTYPKTPFGQGANIRYVKVQLPKQLPSNLATLKKACLDSVFNQNPAACPPASRVGTATATTPVLPVSLSGPAYFISHGGAKFPELIVVLSGYGTTVYLHGETFIDKTTGITSSTFKTIPDVPVGTFQLTLPQGPYSALSAPGGKLCTSKLRMPTTFIAQNGKRLQQSTKITATGCTRHKTKHHKRHRHKSKRHKKK